MTPRGRKVYAASSWRNPLHKATVHTLRSAGFDVYDFMKPPMSIGFSWEQVGITDPCTFNEYIKGIYQTEAVLGFTADLTALDEADIVVLTLPCGKSAHLELGYAIGKGKETAVLFNNPLFVQPELMYKMVDHLADSMFDLLGMLGVED